MVFQTVHVRTETTDWNHCLARPTTSTVFHETLLHRARESRAGKEIAQHTKKVGPATDLSYLVKNISFPFVRKNGIRFVHILEFLLCHFIVGILIRMVLQCHLSVRPLNLVFCSISRNAQQAIKISAHGQLFLSEFP